MVERLLAGWQRRVRMAVAPGDVPPHARQFKALTDEGFAAGFDDARANEQGVLAEIVVAHPVSISLEVQQCFCSLAGGVVG